jgi:hypothetical protein
MDNLSFNITDILHYEPHKSEISLSEFFIDYCNEIYNYNGLIYLLVVFYLIIDMVALPIIQEQTPYVYNFVSRLLIENIIRYTLIILCSSSYAFYLSSVDYHIPVLHWVIFGLIAFLIVGEGLTRKKKKL